MTETLIRKSAVIIFAVVFIAGFLFVDSNAQKRKRRSARRRATAPRITNPEIYQPPANDNSNSNATDSANANTTQPTEDPDAMKKTIRGLSDQVDRLNQKQIGRASCRERV